MHCACGERLLAEVGPETVRTVTGREVYLRRATDHVICSACMSSFAVAGLRRIDRPPGIVGSLAPIPALR